MDIAASQRRVKTGAQRPHVVALLEEAADTLGLTVEDLDPDCGHLIRLTNGKKSITLLGGRSPLNDAVAARICEDKYYTALLLERGGVRVPTSARCIRPGFFQNDLFGHLAGFDAAVALANQHGYPLVVKPNRLSHGRHVALVYDAFELKSAIQAVWAHDYIALAQTPHAGLDLRLDFLDGEFLVGYTRKPGPATLGTSVAEYAILNLTQGAHADILQSIPEAMHSLCKRIGEILGLRYFGVDLKALSLVADPRAATVIEVNASPIFVQLWQQGYRDLACEVQVRVLKAIWDEAS